MPKKPLDELTWKKDDRYAKIHKIRHQYITINKETGKEAFRITQADEIP